MWSDKLNNSGLRAYGTHTFHNLPPLRHSKQSGTLTQLLGDS